MLKVSIPHSGPGESRGRDYTPEAFFSEDPHKEEPSVRSHHRPCRVVPRHIQIAAAGTGQVQVPWEPGSPASGLCQNSRTEPEATGPDAHRVVDPPLLHHHQHSSLIPTPASRLPVAKARAKLLRLLQFCAVAAKPVSADPSLFCFPRSRPLFRRILSPSLSLPFPSSTSLDSIPLKTPKGELASTAILNPRLPPSRVVRTSFTPTTHHLNARTSFLSSSPLQFARATASRPRLNPLLPTSFSPQG